MLMKTDLMWVVKNMLLKDITVMISPQINMGFTGLFFSHPAQKGKTVYLEYIEGVGFKSVTEKTYTDVFEVKKYILSQLGIE